MRCAPVALRSLMKWGYLRLDDGRIFQRIRAGDFD